jgi:hypothetical protein
MKYKIITFVSAAFLLAGFSAAIPVQAASKVCSAHKGANCAAGASFEGKVFCADGTIDAAFNYSDACKTAPSLKCPIALPKDQYDAQKKPLQDAILAVKSANQKLCQDRFDAMEKLNDSLYDSCIKGRASIFKMSPSIELFSDAGACAKNRDEAKADDNKNFDTCAHSTDALVARYQAIMACYSVSTVKTPAFNVTGYTLSSAHFTKNNSCVKYGNYSTLDSASGQCICGNGYSWDAKNTVCVNTMSCAIGSIRNGGQCVTLTKMCIDKYGIGTYAVSTGNTLYECRCGDGYAWNSDKTKCVAK